MTDSEKLRREFLEKLERDEAELRLKVARRNHRRRAENIVDFVFDLATFAFLAFLAVSLLLWMTS